jgi:CheY-like chemotaxis protein
MNGNEAKNLKAVDILLVEDNATDAELCIRALKKHNLANDLVWVKDGTEALDFIFRTGSYAAVPPGVKPKVILLDLRLPKVDGIEVLRRLKGDERTRTIPIAILTSSKEDRDLKECYQLGVNSYIAKPVELSQFADTITKLGLYWLVINRVP